MTLTVFHIVGSVVLLLALGLGANYLVTRYHRRTRQSQADVPAETQTETAWPKVDLTTIGEQSKQNKLRSVGHIHGLAGGGHVGRGRGGVHGVSEPKE